MADTHMVKNQSPSGQLVAASSVHSFRHASWTGELHELSLMSCIKRGSPWALGKCPFCAALCRAIDSPASSAG